MQTIEKYERAVQIANEAIWIAAKELRELEEIGTVRMDAKTIDRLQALCENIQRGLDKAECSLHNFEVIEKRASKEGADARPVRKMVDIAAPASHG